jgi:hypothetical protein
MQDSLLIPEKTPVEAQGMKEAAKVQRKTMIFCVT